MPRKQAQQSEEFNPTNQIELMQFLAQAVGQAASTSRLDPISAKLLDSVIAQNDKLIVILADIVHNLYTKSESDPIDKNIARFAKLKMMKLLVDEPLSVETGSDLTPEQIDTIQEGMRERLKLLNEVQKEGEPDPV